ncbi:MAG TPA: CocE/NonD family hydrolase, partial [Gaiellaceae bacterium]
MSEPAFRVERNILVPLGDGTRLAADLYLPEGDGAFPTLVSFYPYRKDDIIGSFSEYPRRYLVAAGYAHLLVDVRGYGGSEGDSVESMDPRPEGRDAAEVVEWAAAQQWSNGAIAVWGVSYGGLVAFAAAAERPPHLKAIAPVYGFSDIQGDAIAPGGVSWCLGRYHREVVMLAQELAPPSYQDDDGRWLDVWRGRLARVEANGPWSLRWPDHPGADDPYWRERTIELGRIDVPTLLVAGWRDLFPEVMTRAFAEIPAQCRLVVGPWLHVPPDLGPEPYDWLDELRAFFDEHVCGRAPGEQRAPVTVFVQGVGGGWRDLERWPPAEAEAHTWHPGPARSLGAAARAGSDSYEAVASVGTAAGLLDPLGLGVGFPGDQGADDLRSLAYTGEPLEEPLTIAGSPELHVVVVVEQGGPVDLAVRLVDVHPSGAAELITSGYRNIDGGGEALVSLAATAYRLPAGHRLRLALACADFPKMWPTPQPATIRIDLAATELRVPVVADVPGKPASVTPPRAVAERAPWSLGGASDWRVERALVEGTTAVTVAGGEDLHTAAGARVSMRNRATASVADAAPGGAKVEA